MELQEHSAIVKDLVKGGGRSADTLHASWIRDVRESLDQCDKARRHGLAYQDSGDEEHVGKMRAAFHKVMLVSWTEDENLA